MRKLETRLRDVYIIEPEVHGDSRGYFLETWSTRDFEEIGLRYDFVQDNQSFTARRGIIRGLHFQRPPMAQAKLVRVVRGAILDVAVDLRKGSPTYRQWVSVELSAENKRMLMMPRGFAHGFASLTDEVEFLYKVDALYSREHDAGFRYDDPEIGVEWGVDDPFLAEKDLRLPAFADCGADFVYGPTEGE